MIFDARRCELGEGPLWHPLRGELLWFDILNRTLHSQARSWTFSELVSAAGWISRDEVLIASETALFRFDLETGSQTRLIGLEADNRKTRSNDGRADPQGGFWIGTMGKIEGPGTPAQGAIYRYYRGELRKLFAPIAIPNAISFPPGGKTACFTDTTTGRVLRVALDADGWPNGSPETFLDLTAEGLHPDGAVFDADGIFWLAEWGASRVAAYAPDGSFLRAVPFDAPHTSCPAFGGDTLYCTTALHNMDAAARARHPNAGKTFMARGIAQGQPEHQFIA
jgi:sugar lactone lactonase YvrE